jgi:ketosteroid isomerase-like protein
MRTLSRVRLVLPIALATAALALAACARSAAPAEDKTTADTVTTALAKAINAADPAGIANLYAEDAHSEPPAGAASTGRSDIEAYWKKDIGPGGESTKLIVNRSVAQGDLLHIDGTYDVTAKNGVALARGQYQQLWRRVNGDWKIQQEMWRLDPVTQRDPTMAQRLADQWTAAYNAEDLSALKGLYDKDAVLSVSPQGAIEGSDAIAAFWQMDFGTTRPQTELTLTDVYLSGDLAHLEGDYQVTEKGSVTRGHYVQLWMQDGDAWRIHREMWWK